MSQIGRRLKKLEVQLTDESGLIPHSPQWRAHWTRELETVLSGDRTRRILIPLEVVRAFLNDEAAFECAAASSHPGR
jgi:hypothetical protein